MKLTHVGTLVSSFVGALMVTGVSVAHADRAKCNDTRTIARERLFEQNIGVCFNPGQLEDARRSAQEDARNAARRRLEKFDSECAALPGGRIEEVSNLPFSRGTPEWHYESYVDCYPAGPYGREVCHTRRYPTYQYCEIYAKASIRHKCACD